MRLYIFSRFCVRKIQVLVARVKHDAKMHFCVWCVNFEIEMYIHTVHQMTNETQ